MDKKLLNFILDRCETTIYQLSKQIEIPYGKLWCVFNYNYRFNNTELDILHTYMKKKKGWSEYFITRKLTKLRRRNNGNIKRDS